MSKSLYAIGGIGVAGCLVLSLVMEHLLGVRQERTQSPLAKTLEAQLEGRRVGPVVVLEEGAGDRRRLVVRLRVIAGLQKERIADAVLAQAWRFAVSAPQRPADVLVEIGDDEGGPVTTVSMPRANARR